MRSPSVLSSLIGLLFHLPLPQTLAERDALVEHKTFAAPAAVGLRHAFQIFQDAALEVVDLSEAARQQIARCLFAADAAGAEHGDPPVLCGIEMACGEFLELAEAPDAGIDGTGECPQRDLKGVAGIDQKRIGSC